MSTYTICAQCGGVNRIAVEPVQGKAPICGKCKAPLQIDHGVSEVSATSLDILIGKSPLVTVVDFWAPWCGPCRAFAPVFKQAAQALGGRVVFAKVNTEAFPQAGQKFSVSGIPTLIVFSRGRELDRVSGAMPLGDFMAWIEGVVGKVKPS